MNEAQIKSEIRWLENEILKLQCELVKRPGKKKQMEEYRYQIRQKELALTFNY